MEYIRKPLDFSEKSITEAVEKSLINLRTDYIDLYQLHWPERKMNMFGQRGFQIVADAWEDNFKEILLVFDKLIKAGKIRHIGVSNETPWGVMRFLMESEKNNLPRIISIQNPYSLLNRLFEVGLTETCFREKVGLLAYSPLGFGILTGKHLKGNTPKSRIALFPQFVRYTSENATVATERYLELAQDNQLSLTQMALAFVQNQSFVSSTIVGATSIPQLKENIDTHTIKLSEEIITEINKIQENIPNPAP
jgi:aryl-alcohol dehydrogenase-like predicted oxidoreductase